MDVVKEIERLYRLRGAEFVRVAAAIVGSQDQALDVVHDAFVSCVRSASTYRGTGTVEAWIWTSVLNSARKTLGRNSRERRGHVKQLKEPPAPDALTPDDGVRHAIAGLPDRQRLTLFLRYYGDLDYETIAHTLGISVGTVGATLHTATRALRATLSQEVQR